MSVIIRTVLKIGRISAKAHEIALVDNIKQISYVDMVLQVYTDKNEHYEGVFHQYFEGFFIYIQIMFHSAIGHTENV
jgi:hypothetical protein